MNYLFVLNHPAHYHLFKNTINILKNDGHQCHIIAKDKDVLLELLNRDGLFYTKFENNRKIKSHIILSSLVDLYNKCRLLWRFVKNKKPIIMAGTDWAIVLIGRLLNIPAVIFNEDDTRATPENLIFYPFAKHLVLPDCCDRGLWNSKKITYAGYHELAYLHPKRFKYNAELVKKLIQDNKPYAIIRLVSLTASHDVGKQGIANVILERLVGILKEKYRILISFEGVVPKGFEEYQFSFSPNLMHHFLAGADLVIGDSQTMIAEAAVLGTPAIRFNDFVGKIGYLEELENKYFLSQGYKTSQVVEFIAAVEELVENYPSNEKRKYNHKNMLSDKINVTGFFVKYLLNLSFNYR